MREGVGTLLAELMRIKAEGDYNAIKTLVDKYGVRFDPALRDEVVARYKQLDLPTYAAGDVTSVRIETSRDAVRQYLAYGSIYLAR